MAEIGIVIVTHNSETEIRPCLEALQGVGNAEIVVVDNHSSDATLAEASRPGVRIVANSTNRGFAAAANQGFTLLECPFLLLLNPDAVLERGLEALREACCLPGSAGAGGCLLDGEGQPQVGFMVRQLPTPATLILEVLLLNRIWPRNPVNRRYRGLGSDYRARIPVEQPAGAFLMLRRSVWQELGGFDERFWPVWFEDVDFCRRVADRGYRLYFEPGAVAKHTGGHSVGKLAVEKRRVYWYRGLLGYSAKHFRPASFRMVCLAVVTGSLLRGAADLVCYRSFRTLAACVRVVRYASRCFWFGSEAAERVPAPVDLG
jgi:N-acetylglucosaminyl-diphospho-decaprenol L-rhamnosyltransferase